MLVLGRAIDEEFTIIFPDGRKGYIKLVDCWTKGRCKLGFDFPKDVKIFRSELLERDAKDTESNNQKGN